MIFAPNHRLPALLIVLSALLCATGCAGGGGAATRFYVIGPIESPPVPGASALARPLSVQILALELPQYLERFQIATQSGPDRMHFSESNQWGENLRKNLMRTLGRNLSRLLGTNSVGSPLGAAAVAPDYRVRVTIDQFERDTSGVVRLDATWQVVDVGGERPVYSGKSALRSPSTVPSGDYDAIVAAMRNLFGALSVELAEHLVSVSVPAS